MKHSIIMMSFLGSYPRCATNREFKFKRAVNSFLSNIYQNKELIIISDGCEITNRIYDELYSKHENIKLIIAPKQDEGYPGRLRTLGLFLAEGETVSYLDTDDYLSPNYIENLLTSFRKNSCIHWAFYDVYVADLQEEYPKYWIPIVDDIEPNLKKTKWTILPSKVERRAISTGNLIHKIEAREKCFWKNWNLEGSSEDWDFVSQLTKEYGCGSKIDPAGYYMCHFLTAGVDI